MMEEIEGNTAGRVFQSPAAAAFPGRVAISPEEFAKAADIGLSSVRMGLARGEIPHRRVGTRYLIGLATLDEWFARAGRIE